MLVITENMSEETTVLCMENPLVSQLVIHSVIVSFSQSFSLSVGQSVS